MERWPLLTAIEKEWKNLSDFDKAARPWTVLASAVAGQRESGTAMGEEQRDCTLYIALLVHEVYIQRFESLNLYSRLEIWQLVELSFLLSPIEFLPPISTQSFHVSQRGAIIPLGLVKLVGEGCGFKFLDKSLALFLRDGDGVGFNCCHDTIEGRNKRTAGAEACERKLIMAEHGRTLCCCKIPRY